MSDQRNSSDVKEIMKELAAPFEAGEVKFKPQVVRGNRALALAYVDARVIQDRLDGVLGVEGWQDEYTPLPDGSVVCRLQLRLGNEWITKMDVGSPSEQPDGGDRLKAAFSDALKRAAVKFGVGRYLYRLPQIWCDYDPQKKQFMHKPSLPEFAPPSRTILPNQNSFSTPAAAQKRQSAPKSAIAGSGKNSRPANGKELLQRLREYDGRLAGQGLCAQGALMQYVTQEGVKAGHGADLNSWTDPAIQLAIEQTKAFENSIRMQKSEQKAVA
ncbi:MAG TPA: Rad52/Rad22 family DNA repair protein [Gemmataceae bacterium]|nr:Rad52/Rad22 family DNA repair protein [Gemmataceae bacterium]